MRVQKIESTDASKISYTIITENFVPFQPAEQYLVWLESTGKSPNTVRSYAFHLTVFLNYLNSKRGVWNEINTETLIDYVRFLQTPTPNELSAKTYNVIKFPNLKEQTPHRAASTVNVMIAAVVSFYEFQSRLGTSPNLNIYQSSGNRRHSAYKPFLHHISKRFPSLKNTLKLKKSKIIPKTISNEDFQTLVTACDRIRDKFLLCLLFEGGLRIGQALGLRHEDIKSFDNEVTIVPRNNNVNFARAKSLDSYTVHISKSVMELYTDYLINELEDIESDYVFVNLWAEPIGRAMRYPAIIDLFKRLEKNTGIKIHPHMLRHTHATNFIRAGGGMAIAQRRLGHKSIQTTQDIYTHVTDEDMRREYDKYQEKIQNEKTNNKEK